MMNKKRIAELHAACCMYTYNVHVHVYSIHVHASLYIQYMYNGARVFEVSKPLRCEGCLLLMVLYTCMCCVFVPIFLSTVLFFLSLPFSFLSLSFSFLFLSLFSLFLSLFSFFLFSLSFFLFSLSFSFLSLSFSSPVVLYADDCSCTCACVFNMYTMYLGVRTGVFL